MDRWTTFAKTGNLNPTSELIGFETSNPDVVGVKWPAYDALTNLILELNVESTLSNNVDQAFYMLLDGVLQYDFVFRNITFIL
ncbi:hypothetical protein BGZ90_007415 [Linnemannia elongata]|nr:hypothetical protein BGZ90_007415 [Linnemannia elongata]